MKSHLDLGVSREVGRRRMPFLTGLASVAAMLITVTFAVFHLGNYRGMPSLDSPIGYGADALNMYALRGEGLTGFGYAQRTAAPFNFPLSAKADTAQCYLFSLECASLRVVAKFTASPVAAVNLYFFLVFYLCGLSTWAVMRLFGFGYMSSYAAACIYSLLPYHFLRGVNHLSVGNYALVPIFFYACYRAYEFGRRQDGAFVWGRGTTSARRIAQWVLLGLALLWSTTNNYYCLIFLLFLVFSAAISWIDFRQLRSFWLAAGGVLLIGVLYVARTLLLKLSWGAAAGKSFGTYQLTGYGQDELYPLKLIQMLLPAANHRVAALGNLTRTYNAYHPLVNENASNALGFFLGAMLLVLLVATLLGALRSGGIWAYLGRCLIFGILIGALGGIGTIISEASWSVIGPRFALSQARAWNRVYVFVAFILVVYAACLSELTWSKLRRLAPRARFPAAYWIAPVLALGALSLVLADQIPPANWSRLHGDAATYRSDVRFFGKLDSKYQRNYKIFYWPAMVPFGTGYGGLYYSEANRPLLASKHTIVSYGAAPGTLADRWLANTAHKQGTVIVSRLCATGFDGVLVFRKALDGRTSRFANFLAGATKSANQNSDFTYYPLGGLCRGDRPTGTAVNMAVR